MAIRKSGTKIENLDQPQEIRVTAKKAEEIADEGLEDNRTARNAED